MYCSLNSDKEERFKYEWKLIVGEAWLGKEDFIKYYGKTKEELLNEKYPLPKQP